MCPRASIAHYKQNLNGLDRMGFLPSIILSPYDAHWKFMRKLTHQAISKTAVSTYDSYHEADAQRLVNLLLQDPSSWRSAVRL